MTTGNVAARRRDGERGSILMVTLIALTALLAVGGISVMAAKAELEAASASRFSSLALYAAESGVAAGIDYMRSNCLVCGTCATPCVSGPNYYCFSNLVNQDNASPVSPAAIAGNNVQPGAPGNPFPQSSRMWYQVTILNDALDIGTTYAGGADTNAVLTLRSVGFGPNGSSVRLEVDVYSTSCASGSNPAGTPLTIRSWSQIY